MCGGLSGDVTAVVCTVQRSHLSTTVSPLKNDSDPTVKRRFGHHRLDSAQFQWYGVFLTHNVYTYIYTCMYICKQTRHTYHKIACIHAQCFIHIYHICIYFLMVPWDYALRMTYDNKACCFAHHAYHYHGWHGNCSRFLDLPVTMVKTSSTCGCQARTTQ